MQKSCIKPDRFFDEFAPALALIRTVVIFHNLLALRRQPERKFDLVACHANIPPISVRNPAVFLETAGLFVFLTPSGLFLPSQQPLRESPKLPAPRAAVTVAGRARHRGFVLLRRLRLLSPPKTARRRSSSVLAAFVALPHGGATSGFVPLGGYALGWVVKAAQTADTGATAR